MTELLEDPMFQSTGASFDQLDENEGEAVVYYPVDELTLDTDNKRKFVNVIHQHLSSILSVTNDEGVGLSQLLKNDDLALDEATVSVFLTASDAYDQMIESDSVAWQKWLSLCSLARSIYTSGLGSPIEAREDERGNVIITHGHRRFISHLLLESSTVRTIVIYDEKKTTRSVTATRRLAENYFRENLDPDEFIEDLFQVINDHGMNINVKGAQKKLASITGLPLTRINESVKIKQSYDQGVVSDYAWNALVLRQFGPNTLVKLLRKNPGDAETLDGWIDQLQKMGHKAFFERPTKPAKSDPGAYETQDQLDQKPPEFSAEEPALARSSNQGNNPDDPPSESAKASHLKEPQSAAPPSGEYGVQGSPTKPSSNIKGSNKPEADSGTASADKHSGATSLEVFGGMDNARLFIAAVYDLLKEKPVTPQASTEDIENELHYLMEKLI